MQAEVAAELVAHGMEGSYVARGREDEESHRNGGDWGIWKSSCRVGSYNDNNVCIYIYINIQQSLYVLMTMKSFHILSP